MQVATVLTVYGIETSDMRPKVSGFGKVATVLTVYGIETFYIFQYITSITTLQQYLPFTVLKLDMMHKLL